MIKYTEMQKRAAEIK